MNEKNKKWIKGIGLVGFLFFLLKGILWLILGSAFYTWLKELLVILFTVCLPVFIIAQSFPISINKNYLPYSISFKPNNLNLLITEYK